VLLFLLSLRVHAKSRGRMALVGGVFVVMSEVMYFALMAACLNVFLVTGQLRWVTVLAGLAALTLAGSTSGVLLAGPGTITVNLGRGEAGTLLPDEQAD